MNIAVSLNQNFFYCTYVALASLFENNRDSAITVYIMHSELTEEQLMAFEELASKYGGRTVSVWIDRSRFSEQLTTSKEWSIETYYRLMIADVIPKEAERLLYLDGDIIVNGDISEFYHMDFEGKLFGVCSESSANHPEESPQLRTKIFSDLFAKGFLYYNAGVMLWNLKEVRKKYHFSDYMEIAKQFEYTFVTPDQDILNYCHWNEVKYVDTSVYNQFSREAHYAGKDYAYIKEHVKMIHFAGAKPWNADNIHFDIEQLWWDYAKLTPYYIKLCEDFTRKTINDPFIENYTCDMINNINALQADLKESLSLNERLITMLNQR